MPLFDHFQGPLRKYRHWESFLRLWAAEIVRQLNRGFLPPHYVAETHVSLGIQVEADVATFHDEPLTDGATNGVTTAVWAPACPTVASPVAFDNPELVEIQVINEEEGPRLVATIELVSPSNKDRPANRRAFGIKCASYLQQGVSVILADVITSRSGDLHAEMLNLLQLPDPVASPFQDLYAAAYRTLLIEKQMQLEAWCEPLALGAPLPTLPLWLSPTLALPLDLEQSYLATCQSLRIAG